MRRVLVILAAFGVLAAACGGSNGAQNTTAPTTTGTTSSSTSAPSGPPATTAPPSTSGPTSVSANTCTPDQLNLVKSGQLTVGTDNPAYPPWFSGGSPKGSMWKVDDPNDGKGLESAVAFEVAKRLGFSSDQVEWVVAPFNQTYAPGSKNYDFAIEQISYTKKRAEAVDFSDSYYDVNQALVAIKGSPVASATSIADLKDFNLAAPIGTTAYTFITDVIKPNTEPGVYNTLSDTVAALNAHQIDAMVVDLPTAVYVADPFVQEVKNSVVVGQFANPAGGGTTDHVAMAFVKGNPLVTCVNQALASMKSDGTLAALQKEWLSQKTNVGVIPVFKS
jgi:polar amino acid transport system substrate-binding protein